MQAFELEFLRKEKKTWEMSTMILGKELDTLDKMQRYGRIDAIGEIIKKFEDVVVAP